MISIFKKIYLQSLQRTYFLYFFRITRKFFIRHVSNSKNQLRFNHLNKVIMKKLSFRITVAAILMVVGTMGLSAQIGRGGVCLNKGVCVVESGVCTTQLTPEQQDVLDALYVEFQAEMDLLRTAMQSAAFVDKLAIRKEMIDLRTAHLDEVKALLEEWGY